MVQSNYTTSAKGPVERFTCTTSLLHESASGFTEFDPVTKHAISFPMNFLKLHFLSIYEIFINIIKHIYNSSIKRYQLMTRQVHCYSIIHTIYRFSKQLVFNVLPDIFVEEHLK